MDGKGFLDKGQQAVLERFLKRKRYGIRTIGICALQAA